MPLKIEKFEFGLEVKLSHYCTGARINYSRDQTISKWSTPVLLGITFSSGFLAAKTAIDIFFRNSDKKLDFFENVCLFFIWIGTDAEKKNVLLWQITMIHHQLEFFAEFKNGDREQAKYDPIIGGLRKIGPDIVVEHL